MALDQWLFQQCAQGFHPPVLRFYTWTPPAISLGKNQQDWPQHWEQLTWNQQPIDLVRRPSGGRAVLHQGDLTYMLVVTEQSRNRRQTYEALCEFLIQGWEKLGVTLQYGEAGSGYRQQPNCFAIATTADLVTVDGTKLVGSAQAWQRTTVLQHGSMRLRPDPKLYAHIFGAEASSGFKQSSTIQNLSHETIIQALVQSAESCFQTQFHVQPLTQSEISSLPYSDLQQAEMGA